MDHKQVAAEIATAMTREQNDFRETEKYHKRTFANRDYTVTYNELSSKAKVYLMVDDQPEFLCKITGLPVAEILKMLVHQRPGMV
jgi:hypothetical protein